MAYHANTNYSVVDIDLIDDLYRQMYREKVLGTERLRFLNVSGSPAWRRGTTASAPR